MSELLDTPYLKDMFKKGEIMLLLTIEFLWVGLSCALQSYIECNGGKVILATTLTSFSVPELETLNFVKNKHPKLAE
uniref:hypothetical protein n=1 Tax=Acinetobacter ursingii TaxID=108980 RepID=UPI001E2933B2|nr:hypothetical protein [Acinetobacter ursingii]